MRILIADDDLDLRLLTARIIEKMGYEVVLANDGVAAWEILKKDKFHFVITDWIMPNMSGLELCEKIRNADFPHYIYIIMLTARDSDTELVKGMNAGADDFIVKPFKKEELHVRIKAGERIIQLETDLSEKNQKLNHAYSVIKKDLEAAGRIQESLLPKQDLNILDFQFEWMFLPSAFVAGDIFNYFQLDEHHIGFYLLDVAGHGIPAALLSVTISKVLSPLDIHAGILKHFISNPPHYEITSPARVVDKLNNKFQADDDTMQYFTMIYGVIDARSGETTMTQAGHPNPILLKKNGEVMQAGDGGFPVGMLPEATYDEFQITLEKGDRLILYSDGIIECNNEKNEQFSIDRFMNLLQENKQSTRGELTQKIKHKLNQWNGTKDFDDDVTLLIMEMNQERR